MATKLVSANMGIVLIVEKDGKQEKKELTLRCPDGEFVHPYDALGEMAEFLNDMLGTDFIVTYDVKGHTEIAKPKRIKAKRPISQDEFNQKIKALVP